MEIKVLATGSSGNCYRVSDGQTPLLLECGVAIDKIRKGLDFRLSEVKGCLVTHEHGDHIKSIADMLKAGIPCYMSRGTAEAAGLEEHHCLKVIEAKAQFRVGSWTILPFETQHDAAEPLGFLLAGENTKLLYVTDSYYCKYRFSGLTHIMVECNYRNEILAANVESGRVSPAQAKRIVASHFEIENVKAFLGASDLSQVVGICLIHLSGDNSDAEQFKKEIQAATGKPVYV